MRAADDEELAAISGGLVRMARLAGSAMGRATTALLEADLQLAESVIAADETLDRLQREVEERAVAVLEHQRPEGSDLRMVVTALRIGATLERAGDLAQHVAKLARLRYPDAVVPDDLHTTVLEMGQLAQRLMAKAAEIIATRDAKAAAQLATEDDRMDDLHRVLFQHLMDQHWHHGVETAVDVTLAGRFYERFADHAVTAADRVSHLGAPRDDGRPAAPAGGRIEAPAEAPEAAPETPRQRTWRPRRRAGEVREIARDTLLRRGFALEYATLGWNVVGIVVLGIAAVAARSVALAGFGLDSLIEIGASAVVVWELSGTGEARRRRALRLIGTGFALLALYLLVQSTWVLAAGFRPHPSPLGIGWTAATAAAMFALAAGKARTGAALANPVLSTEGRVTLIDGLLATAVLAGLCLNSALGWWWADPAAGYVLVYYAVREARVLLPRRAVPDLP